MVYIKFYYTTNYIVKSILKTKKVKINIYIRKTVKITQQEIRVRLIELIEKEGIRQNYIAEKIDIPNSILSQFKKGNRSLNKKSLNDLNVFLNNHGY